MRSAWRGAWRDLPTCALALLLGAGPCSAQTAQALPPATQPLPLAMQPLPLDAQDALHTMAQLAGVVFTGQVVAVRRHEGLGGATGILEIQFAVEDAVRGVRGDAYTLREWAGLAPAQDLPFRVGQRFLMLLHAPSAAGFSSPVGGTDGAIPIRGGAAAPLSPQQLSTSSQELSTQADGPLVDLRWVGMRAVRPVAYTPQPVARPSGLPIAVDPDTAPSSAANRTTQPPASQNPDYAGVLALLRGWEVADHAAR